MTSANEKIRDNTIKHMLYLESLKTKEANKILRFYEDHVIPDLIDRLEARLLKIEKFGFDRGEETTKRLNSMIDELNEILSRIRQAKKPLKKELRKLSLDEIKWQIGSIRESLGVNINFVIPAAETVRQSVFNTPFDGRTLNEWFASLEDSAKSRLRKEIQKGVTEGLTTQQIVSSIRGTRSLNYTDGVLNTTRSQTAAVVHTAIQHATNRARNEVFQANSSIIKGIQWVATLDTHTCLQCAPLDGKIYPVGKGLRPPIHVNCRCTVIAVLKSWRELGIDADEIPQSTRASINGQVPGTITYSEWLKKQKRSIVEEALGKTRAKLFLDGDLELTSFVTNKRHELTLDEIRKRESKAFRLAKL